MNSGFLAIENTKNFACGARMKKGVYTSTYIHVRFPEVSGR